MVGLRADGEWLLPMALSAEVALGSAVCALVLGSAAAYGLSRGTGRGRGALEGFLATPLLLPEIVISLSVVQLVSMLGARGLIGPPLLVVAHALVGIPFVLRTVGVSLLAVDPVWERAARDLGASAWRAFATVTLPLMRSGMFAGALFAFIVSFNNVELSLFLTSRTRTRCRSGSCSTWSTSTRRPWPVSRSRAWSASASSPASRRGSSA